MSPKRHGYIAALTLPGGRGGGILDLRCESEEVARSQEFRDLAMRICEVLARRSPRFLDVHGVPLEAVERIRRSARVEALRRGIPDDDLEEYSADLAERRIADLCLLELPLGEGTVAEALAAFPHPVAIRLFYRVSVDD